MTSPEIHHYLSTACFHGRHDDCGLCCTVCAAECECTGCDHTEPARRYEDGLAAWERELLDRHAVGEDIL